jgi:FeS assembly SUF system protein
MRWHISRKSKVKCQKEIKMSEALDFLEIEGKIVEALKNVYDPEIPVNIYDLGLIYEIDFNDKKEANIRMTLTAPNCPVVDILLMDVEDAVGAVEGVEKVHIDLVFDPPWDKSMLSEEAKLELGFL